MVLNSNITISENKIRVLAKGLRFPEGPAFDLEGNLWAVELKGEALVQWKDGLLTRHHVGGMPNGIAIHKSGNIWFCDSGDFSVRRFDPANRLTTDLATHVDGERLNRPNDLAFDSHGNLVFTCPGESRQEPTGYACVLMRNGTIKKITSAKYFPNGLAFSNDGQFLVIAETYRHRLWIGEWNADKGEWDNERIWCDIGGPDGPGGPDGMAFHKNGKLYVAVYGTAKIKVVDESGMVCSDINLPGRNPTNCAFVPGKQEGLIVTEAENGQLLYVEL